jgi:hypothetical protein
MSARITGLQAAEQAIDSLLGGPREQFAPQEYAVLVDLLIRRVMAESRAIDLGDADE